MLLCSLVALSLQLPDLRLLIRRQESEDLAAQAGLLDRHLGLCVDQCLRRGADQPFVDGYRFSSLPLRLHRAPKLLADILILLARLLRQLFDLGKAIISKVSYDPVISLSRS